MPASSSVGTAGAAHTAPEGPGVPVLARELAQAPLFAELPNDALHQLATGARRRRFAPGDVVFHEGAPGDALHVIRRGLLAVVRPSRDPGLILNRMGPGECFGEIAVLTESARLASVVTVDPTQTLEAHKEEFPRRRAAN